MEYILSKEECLEKGGHIYERGFMVFTSPELYRKCKYCGNEQVGHQPEVIWQDKEEKK